MNTNSQPTTGLLVSVPVSSAGGGGLVGQQMTGPGGGGQQTVVLTNSGGGQQLPFGKSWWKILFQSVQDQDLRWYYLQHN